MINTAVLDGEALNSTLAVWGALPRGGALLPIEDAVCTRGLLPLPGCRVLLTGAESAGGVSSVLVVTQGRSRAVELAVYFPDLPLRMVARDATLNRVHGWFIDSGCDQVRRQSTDVVATATFTAGGGRSLDADVSSRLGAQLVSDAPGVAAVSALGSVQGVTAGRTVVRAVNSLGRTLGECNITVSDAHVRVARLDVAVVASLGPIAVSATAAGPFEVLSLSLNPEAPTFRYGGDSAAVTAAARFSDGSIGAVGVGEGLVLQSFAPESIVAGASSVSVPRGGHLPAAGLLLRAAWTPVPQCKTLAAVDVPLAIETPRARELRVLPPTMALVAANDPASRFWSTQRRLRVFLDYDGRTVGQQERDPRTRFAVVATSVPGLITISEDGHVQANGAGLNGTATIEVSFEGQNVTATAEVVVGKFADLKITCRSWPTSDDASPVANLSRVGTSEPPTFERGALSVQMTVTDGRQPHVFAKLTVLDFSVVDAATGLPSGALAVEVSDSEAVVRVLQAPATVRITPSYFAASSSRGLTLTLRAEPVFVAAVDAMRFFMLGAENATDTFGGVAGQAAGHVQLDATLTNGRRFPDVFTPLGTSRLPGQIQLASAAPAAASIDADSGLATLYDNSYEPVLFRALVNGVELAALGMPCNLDPDGIGDIDLGEALGLPAPPVSPGASVVLPLSVATGEFVLGAFNLILRYDRLRLTVAPEEAVAPDTAPGSVLATLAYSVGVDAEGRGTVQIAGSLDPSTLGGPRAALLTVKFEVSADAALFPAVVPFDVEVLTLENSAIPAQIIAADLDAAAGSIEMLIEGPGARRSTRAMPRERQRRRGRRNPPNGTAVEDCIIAGDTDGNAIFTAGDSLFVLKHIVSAAPAINFSNAGGAAVLAVLATHGRALAELDADGNGLINLDDAVMLTNVLVGQLAFMRYPTAAIVPDGRGGCDTEVNILTFGVQGSSGAQLVEVPESTRVFLDLSLDVPLLPDGGASVITAQRKRNASRLVIEAERTPYTALFGVRLPAAVRVVRVAAIQIGTDGAGSARSLLSGYGEDVRSSLASLPVVLESTWLATSNSTSSKDFFTVASAGEPRIDLRAAGTCSAAATTTTTTAVRAKEGGASPSQSTRVYITFGVFAALAAVAAVFRRRAVARHKAQEARAAFQRRRYSSTLPPADASDLLFDDFESAAIKRGSICLSSTAQEEEEEEFEPEWVDPDMHGGGAVDDDTYVSFDGLGKERGDSRWGKAHKGEEGLYVDFEPKGGVDSDWEFGEPEVVPDQGGAWQGGEAAPGDAETTAAWEPLPADPWEFGDDGPELEEFGNEALGGSWA